MIVNRNYTNISCKALGQLISLKDAASRTVSKNAVYNKENVYYLPAIRLFLSLNFKVSTKDGTAEGLNTKELAEECCCCEKTVLSSFKKLASGDNPLISYNIDKNTRLINVALAGYTDMFKRRGEGGLGYIVMENSLFRNFKDIDNINEMRVFIRSMLECEEQEGYEASLSMKEFVSGLPSYVRPCNVKGALNNLSSFFHTVPNANKKSFLITIKDDFRSKEKKEKKFNYLKSLIWGTIKEINEKIDFINESLSLKNSSDPLAMSSTVASSVKNFFHVSFDYKKAREDKILTLPCFNFTTKEYEDAAQIATQLDFYSVKGALLKYLEQYVLTGRGSKRRDTMAIIQNMSEAIYQKSRTFIDEENDSSDYQVAPAL